MLPTPTRKVSSRAAGSASVSGSTRRTKSPARPWKAESCMASGQPVSGTLRAAFVLSGSGSGQFFNGWGALTAARTAASRSGGWPQWVIVIVPGRELRKVAVIAHTVSCIPIELALEQALLGKHRVITSRECFRTGGLVGQQGQRTRQVSCRLV